jgi:hypothetical protein
MAANVQNFSVGDLLKLPTAQLFVTDTNGNKVPMNLTGMTVAFRMVPAIPSSPPVPTIANAGALIINAAEGIVAYEWQWADVANPGIFYAWFIVNNAGALEHFPCTGTDYQINIYPTDGTSILA